MRRNEPGTSKGEIRLNSFRGRSTLTVMADGLDAVLEEVRCPCS